MFAKHDIINLMWSPYLAPAWPLEFLGIIKIYYTGNKHSGKIYFCENVGGIPPENIIPIICLRLNSYRLEYFFGSGDKFEISYEDYHMLKPVIEDFMDNNSEGNLV